MPFRLHRAALCLDHRHGQAYAGPEGGVILGRRHDASGEAPEGRHLALTVPGPRSDAADAPRALDRGGGGCGWGPVPQFAALLPISERVLGPEHPDTLTTRHNLAPWTGRAGMRPRPVTSSPTSCPSAGGSWALSTPTPCPPATNLPPGLGARKTRLLARADLRGAALNDATHSNTMTGQED